MAGNVNRSFVGCSWAALIGHCPTNDWQPGRCFKHLCVVPKFSQVKIQYFMLQHTIYYRMSIVRTRYRLCGSGYIPLYFVHIWVTALIAISQPRNNCLHPSISVHNASVLCSDFHQYSCVIIRVINNRIIMSLFKFNSRRCRYVF